jgi:hypothetical protein
MSLDRQQYRQLGFYRNAYDGAFYGVHQPGVIYAQPPDFNSPVAFGQLPQDGVIVCEYDRTRATIAFGWPGVALQVTYQNVPSEPQLVPAFHFAFEGDSVELL